MFEKKQCIRPGRHLYGSRDDDLSKDANCARQCNVEYAGLLQPLSVPHLKQWLDSAGKAGNTGDSLYHTFQVNYP